MPWFVYILRCGNGDLYTGVTNHLARRLAEHQSKKGGRFTAAHQPVELVYHEQAKDRSAALRREQQVQGWSRRNKLALVASDKGLLKAD
ncbi:MAG: GIY-YIG nuclease family protein [Candidatus Omnitrophica bacterium]|nr:GIY-YIG nuclease family protein [Candidatus Omnitrophota bacterium]